MFASGDRSQTSSPDLQPHVVEREVLDERAGRGDQAAVLADRRVDDVAVVVQVDDALVDQLGDEDPSALRAHRAAHDDARYGPVTVTGCGVDSQSVASRGRSIARKLRAASCRPSVGFSVDVRRTKPVRASVSARAAAAREHAPHRDAVALQRDVGRERLQPDAGGNHGGRAAVELQRAEQPRLRPRAAEVERRAHAPRDVAEPRHDRAEQREVQRVRAHAAAQRVVQQTPCARQQREVDGDRGVRRQQLHTLAEQPEVGDHPSVGILPVRRDALHPHARQRRVARLGAQRQARHGARARELRAEREPSIERRVGVARRAGEPRQQRDVGDRHAVQRQQAADRARVLQRRGERDAARPPRRAAPASRAASRSPPRASAPRPARRAGSRGRARSSGARCRRTSRARRRAARGRPR